MENRKFNWELDDIIFLEISEEDKKSLSAYLVKHLSGQHDQSSHGRRGSHISESRSENANNGRTSSKKQMSINDVFGEKLAMEFSLYSDISRSPQFTKIAEVFAEHIKETTGSKILEKESGEMIKGVKAYAGSLDQYKKIRSGIPPEIAKSIESLISISPKFDGKVYRGMSFSDKKFVSQLKIGAQIDMVGFSSWSSNKKWAKQFSERDKVGVVFEMRNKNGVSITHLSKDYSEKEILVSGKSKIIINNIVEKNGVYYVKATES